MGNHYLSQRGFQHWANQLAYSALIGAGAEVMNGLAAPIGFYDYPTGKGAGLLP